MKQMIIIAVLLGITCTACDKWFDVSPKTEMKADDLFKDERGFVDALTGAYSLMTVDNLYGKELTMGFVEVLGQTYDGISSSTTSPYQNAAAFKYTETSEESRLNRIWKAQYNAIANINGMLSYMERNRQVLSNKGYQLIKGEALALRGFLHFDLLRLFAPAPITGKEQAAIPYVASYTNQAYPRLTVEQVLENVITDADSACYYLKHDDSWGPDSLSVDLKTMTSFMKNRVLHINYYAVTGFLARVYLYQGNRAKAFEKAEEVISSNRFPLCNSSVTALTRLFPTEHIWSLSKKNLAESLEKLYGTGLSTSPVSMTVENIGEIYKDAGALTDLRKNSWFENNKIIKFSNNSQVPLLRVSEMYLIAAECAESIHVGQSYLNALREHRKLEALPNFGEEDQQAFSEALSTEIRKEYLLDGQLFYFYKRNNEKKLPGLPELSDASLVYNLPIPDQEFEFGNMNF